MGDTSVDLDEVARFDSKVICLVFKAEQGRETPCESVRYDAFTREKASNPSCIKQGRQ